MVMVHGHGTLRSLRKRACISSLLISSSDFFYTLDAAGQLSRHLGFPNPNPMMVTMMTTMTMTIIDFC